MSVRKILVYGENPNDTKSIVFLLEALCPGMRGRLVVRRGPLLLVKNMQPSKFSSRADKAARLLAAENAKASVECVFMHEDADAVEPAHIRARCPQATSASHQRFVDGVDRHCHA
jgi:hypothetical protein